jgi:cold shock CspA family protein
MNSDRVHGELATWLDSRHFGFLKLDSGEKDVFVGEAAFREHDVAPVRGERYSFRIDTDDRGRRRATDVLYSGVEKAARELFNPVVQQ